MNTLVGSIAAVSPSSVGSSVLKSANKQPELALELLLKTLAGNVTAAQTPRQPVAPAEAVSGQRINVIA